MFQPQQSLYSRVKELESELSEKVTLQAEANAKIKDLETKLSKKDAKDVKSKEKIQELEIKLSACSLELEAVYGQLERTQLDEISRLKNSSNWSAAASILQELVDLKEKQLTTLKVAKDDAKALVLSKELCSYHRQLGELYLNTNDLVKAERYTRKAFDQRVKLLGIEHAETRYTEQQLCTILRKTGNDLKIAEAATIYFRYWIKPNHNKFALECGHELGCLYHEQHQYKDALPVLWQVWEERRVHPEKSQRDQAMSTADHLISILSIQGKETEKITILEEMWKQHTGELVLGTSMLQYADDLANIYWSKKNYDEAKPVLAALWAARKDDLARSRAMQTAAKEACLGTWFLSGYRNAVALTKVGGNKRLKRARTVLEPLWTSRTKLPSATPLSVINIADCYSYILLQLDEPQLAEEIAGTTWNEAKEIDRRWELSESTLYVGEHYASALSKNDDGTNNKLLDSKRAYEELFVAWKKLSALERSDRHLEASAIKCGHALLDVTERRNKAPKRCALLRIELAALERAASSNMQRRLAF